MRIGVLILPTDPWPATVERARTLEALGYDHLWTYDHLSWRRYRDKPWHAAIPWLTGVAGVTSRIRLGTMVTSPNFRHPVTLAKDAMTLDHVSGGRVILGVGAGGTGFDATVLGPDPGHRSARFAEFVEVLDGLLKHPAGYSHQGRFYTVDDARTLPGARIPIAVAAAGPKALAVAARHGDAWITYGEPDSTASLPPDPRLRRGPHPDLSPAQIERAVRIQSERLAEACAAIGRDPAELQRIYLIGNTEERPLQSVTAFTDFAGRYAALGFTDLVFHDPRPDDPVWHDDPAVVAEIALSGLSGRKDP